MMQIPDSDTQLNNSLRGYIRLRHFTRLCECKIAVPVAPLAEKTIHRWLHTIGCATLCFLLGTFANLSASSRVLNDCTMTFAQTSACWIGPMAPLAPLAVLVRTMHLVTGCDLHTVLVCTRCPPLVRHVLDLPNTDHCATPAGDTAATPVLPFAQYAITRRLVCHLGLYTDFRVAATRLHQIIHTFFTTMSWMSLDVTNTTLLASITRCATIVPRRPLSQLTVHWMLFNLRAIILNSYSFQKNNLCHLRI